VKKLLDRNQASRGTVASIKKFKWFDEFDWSALMFQKIVPEYRPTIKQINTAACIPGTVQDIVAKGEEPDRVRTPGRRPAPFNWDKDF
jgi:hypothetical protein